MHKNNLYNMILSCYRFWSVSESGSDELQISPAICDMHQSSGEQEETTAVSIHSEPPDPQVVRTLAITPLPCLVLIEIYAEWCVKVRVILVYQPANSPLALMSKTWFNT